MDRVSKIKVSVKVNGKTEQIEDYPMARLLDILRINLELSGSKEGCGEGECGACSVFVDGELVNSCLMPLAQLHGKEIQTIEGIGSSADLNKVQKAFLECGGAQCGICTPGMVLASCDLLKRQSNPSRDDIKWHLSGNLCRCTGYMRIFEAVEKAAAEV